jgi:hypothetical protein
VRLSSLYEQYRDRVQFLVIYIREAHPKDGWWFGEGLLARTLTRRFSPKVSLDIVDPKTLEDRQVVAAMCEDALQYGIQTYVDRIDDPVSKAYAAKPTRLYLIASDGRVAYAGGLGPYGFSPEELKRAIDDLGRGGF